LVGFEGYCSTKSEALEKRERFLMLDSGRWVLEKSKAGKEGKVK